MSHAGSPWSQSVTLEPQRLNLELCVEAQPGVTEVYSGIKEDHPGAMEVHSGTMEAYPGAMEEALVDFLGQMSSLLQKST